MTCGVLLVFGTSDVAVHSVRKPLYDRIFPVVRSALMATLEIGPDKWDEQVLRRRSRLFP